MVGINHQESPTRAHQRRESNPITKLSVLFRNIPHGLWPIRRSGHKWPTNYRSDNTRMQWLLSWKDYTNHKMGRGFYHLWWPSSTTNPRSKACHTPSGIVEGPPGQDTTPKVCKQWPQRQDSEHANDLLGNVERTSRLFVEICGLTVHTNTPGCNPIQLIPVPSRYWW
jgi:hypothetical protein